MTQSGRLITLSAFVLLAPLTLKATSQMGATPRSANERSRVECGAMYPSHPRTGERVRVAAGFSGDGATLTGTYRTEFGPEISKPTLEIRDHGRAVLSERLGEGPAFFKDSVSLGYFPVYDGGATVPQGSLCVARLVPGEQPSMLLDLYTGGAHCCTVLDAYRFGSDRRTLVSVDLGNPDGELVMEGGRLVIITADNSFAYAFSSFAGSGMPVEVLAFSGHAFTNVTRQYLGIVAEDSDTWQSGYYADPADASGLIAAWVADEDLLGRSASAWSFIEGALRSHELKVTPWFRTDAAYLKALRALLVKDGYQPA
jgi:hypothetical protein